MSLDTIATLLSQHVGFAPKIIGKRKIQRAVEHRQVACRLPDIQTYLQVLQSSPQELNELVEQLVVPETWFFRDRKPFDFLVEFVRSQWLSKSQGAKLRVLSVPCSTGEEPYSIAIALLEAGLPAHRFSIDAIDISQRALAKAQRATYGKNSFRGEDWVDRSLYFQAIEGQYGVCPLVRNLVTFCQGNLLGEFPITAANYDVIFCRNLLIYLEETACQQIFTALHTLLTPQGLLFVGAAETAKVPSDRFSYIRQAFTFAYRKIDLLTKVFPQTDLKQSYAKPPADSSPTQASAKLQVKTISPNRHRDLHITVANPPSNPVPAIPSAAVNLQQAQQLADAGQLHPAIACCKTYLEHHSTNAEAHALLGTLYQATANFEQAERCFQKALYLQPNFYEALMHLALLKESRGDASTAERLRQRIQKLQPTS
ncbi:MAG: CheR family methyltransferase [Leptolyngbyaceae cyanobacterium bins.349]|nr:CheR family methyltransferase [Leptolyngbyaceae cyanobacterium bins.349]